MTTSTRPAPVPPAPGAVRGPLGRRAGVVITVFFSLFLVSFAVDVLRADGSTAAKTAHLAVLAVYGLSYGFGAVLLWNADLRRKLALVAWLTVLLVALLVIGGLGTMMLATYIIGPLSVMFPFRWTVGLAGGLLAGLLVAMVVTGQEVMGAWLGLLAVAASVALMGRLMTVNRELHTARHELAAMAVSEERARVARDLHDVLGHSLTTITVKAGLARRILESDPTGVDRAVAEIADLERLSRQALTEVRATVSGYRKASLAAELAGANVALAAADIVADLPQAVDDVPPELQESFAYVVREGVTNVLRHSGATRCGIRLGASWVEVRDDGPAEAATDGTARPTALPGNGLTGLRERLAAVGGTLDAGPLAGGGFMIRASVEEKA
ncbi:histidine kinase [Longispora sp. NPDC051575]|uniref:sensor histidine kinase n=1 Tax=Longispora sp. NPDC051575 TaxID=3154943 RepID=UPI003437C99B